jgi:tripartite-type tricarboxylate transporter receptor subunit TctC
MPPAVRVHRPWLDRALAMMALAAALAVSAASAQDHRVVTIIVPYPAGGIGDILPRAMADVLAQQTGQSFVVDNKPGATQMIGARLEATIWFGFLAPAGTPKETVDRLARDMNKAVESGALRERLKAAATEIELVVGTPEQFRAHIQREIPHWRGVIRAANIPLE